MNENVKLQQITEKRFDVVIFVSLQLTNTIIKI